MNFDFSDSQKELQGEVHRFLRDRCDLSVAREVLDDENLTHAAAFGGKLPNLVGAELRFQRSTAASAWGIWSCA